jgi:hypothetical protein
MKNSPSSPRGILAGFSRVSISFSKKKKEKKKREKRKKSQRSRVFLPQGARTPPTKESGQQDMYTVFVQGISFNGIFLNPGEGLKREG